MGVPRVPQIVDLVFDLLAAGGELAVLPSEFDGIEEGRRAGEKDLDQGSW
jgi:hypothetical protein